MMRREKKMFQRWQGYEMCGPSASGAGTVEMVLILVVLISLVIIFKGQLTSLLNLIFEQIQSSAGSVF